MANCYLIVLLGKSNLASGTQAGEEAVGVLLNNPDSLLEGPYHLPSM